MIDVEITNYESINHTKFQIEGFTTLIGRNYLGKSSVLRAINAALTNKDGTDFISWGQTFCEVHIIFPDLDVLWHKEDGNNFYRINGKEYNKIGRGTPPQEILDAGYRPISIGDLKVNLNYAVQFFPLFLVDKRDSKSADILTSVYGLDRIYRAIGLCNKDQRSNSDLLKLREKDLVMVGRGMEKFKPFPDIAAKLPELKSKKKELEKEEGDIKRIQQWGVNLRVLLTQTRRLKPVSDIIIPEPNEITEGIAELQKLVRYDVGVNQISTFLKRIKPVQGITLPENNVSEIKAIFSEYQKLFVWHNTYKKLSDEISRLESIKDIKIPTATLDLEDIPKLKQTYDRVKTLSVEVKGLQVSIGSLTTEIEKVEKELDSFDLCPLCGAKRG
jgi:hypothetical protein